MNITPANFDFFLYQRSSQRIRIAWKSGNDSVDLTDCTAKMQVRSKKGLPATLLEMDTDSETIEIYLDETSNLWIIQLNFPSSLTSTLDFTRAYYDLYIFFPPADWVSDPEPVRILEGFITTSGSVTQW